MMMQTGVARGAGRRTPAFPPLDERLIEQIAVAAMILFTAAAYVVAYHRHYAVQLDPNFPDWWHWNDQGKYFRAARAWASGSLDPAQHWYFPGYPLLGALFVAFDPGHPFYIVDLACLLAYAALFVQLTTALAPRTRFIRAYASLAFGITVPLTPFLLKSFIEPWTTTPTAPLTLAALLLAFRCWDTPTPRRAAGLGLVTASLVLFRPVDVVPCLAAVVFCSAAALWRRPDRVRLGLAGAAGTALPFALAAAIYLAINGWTRSPYMVQSGQTGFEWRLIPLHWVTIVVSPQREFTYEFSLAQTFSWLIPGVAGMAASLYACRGRLRLRHALVVSAVALHCVLYLAYRDLHPPGLFRFANYHYLKWCLPLFGLYALLLVAEVSRSERRGRAWGLGLLVILALFSWRMRWQDLGPEGRVELPRTLHLPNAPRSVYDGIRVPAVGGFSQIYLADYVMQIGQRRFFANADFKSFATDDGLIFTVLRPMPPGPAVITFNEGVTLTGGIPHRLRATLFWRWPHLASVVTFYWQRWFSAHI